jgi:hypothetical protein
MTFILQGCRNRVQGAAATYDTEIAVGAGGYKRSPPPFLRIR